MLPGNGTGHLRKLKAPGFEMAVARAVLPAGREGWSDRQRKAAAWQQCQQNRVRTLFSENLQTYLSMPALRFWKLLVS